MRASLLAYTAAACLMSAFVPHDASATTVKCKITDIKNNVMVYTLTEAVAATDMAELSYEKNDAVVSSRDAQGHYPLWRISYDAATYVLTFTSRVSPDWSILTYINPSPSTGGASLFHNNNKVGNGTCIRMDAPAVAPAPVGKQYVPPVASSDTTTVRDSVAFTLTSNQQIIVKVGMGGWVVDMLLDTGANESSVGADLAAKLIAQGDAVAAGEGHVNLADGSTVTEKRIIVKSVTIGEHVLTDIPMGIVKDHATMLLGLPVLNKIGKFTIDSEHQRLTFG